MFRTSIKHFAVITIVTMLLLATVTAMFQMPADASDPKEIDLTVYLDEYDNGQGQAGGNFEVTGTIKNNSNEDLTGVPVQFTFTFAPGTTNPEIICTFTNDLSCVDSHTITPATLDTPGQITGFISSLTAQLGEPITFSGNFPATASTAEIRLEVFTPAGYVDNSPDTNIVYQNFALDFTELPTTTVGAGIWQNSNLVQNSTFHEYHVTFINSGNYAAHIDVDFDYLTNQSFSHSDYHSGAKPTGVYRTGQSAIDYVVECAFTSSATCPQPAYKYITGTQTDNRLRLYQYRDTSQTSHLVIPPHQKIDFTISVKDTLPGCIDGANATGAKLLLAFRQSATSPAQFNAASEELATVLEGQQCADNTQTTLTTTVTQDSVVTDSGATKIYTVTYENTGQNTANAKLLAQLDLNPVHTSLKSDPAYQGLNWGDTAQGNSEIQYTIDCDPASTVPCPAVFDAHSAAQTKSLTDFTPRFVNLYDSSDTATTNNSYFSDFETIIAPGQKLILTIPVTQTFSDCITDGEYLPVRFTANATTAANAPIYFQDAVSAFAAGDGAIKHITCPTSSDITVNVEQSAEITNAGEARTYTITYENTGALPGEVRIADTLQLYSNATVNVPGQGIVNLSSTNTHNYSKLFYTVSCAAGTTTTCPAHFNNLPATAHNKKDFKLYDNAAGSVSNYNSNYPITIPAGKKLVLNVEVRDDLALCIKNSPLVGISNIASAQTKIGNAFSVPAQSAPLYGAIRCNDVTSKTKGYTLHAYRLGSPISFDSIITNAAGSVTNIPVSIVFPREYILTPQEAVDFGAITDISIGMRFDCYIGSDAFDYGSEIPCPADMVYDPVTHKISGTYTGTLEAGNWFKVRGTAYSGYTRGKTRVSAQIRTEIGEITGDINRAYNNSTANITIANQKYDPVVRIHLNEPTPAPITITGHLICPHTGNQNSTPPGIVNSFTANIPVGAMSIEVPLADAYTSDYCYVRLVSRSDSYGGFHWIDEDIWSTDTGKVAFIHEGFIFQGEFPEIVYFASFNMKIASAPPPPPLPLSGGVSTLAYVLIGSGVITTAILYSYLRRKHILS